MFRRSFAPILATLAAAGSVILALGTTTPAVAYPAAENIFTSEQCVSVDSVRLAVSWTGYNMGDQWLDVSLANNGFAPGTFASVGPIPSGQDSVVGEGLNPGAWIYFRVNTLTAGGWAPSDTFAVFSPECVLATPLPPAPAPLPPAPAPLPPAPAPLPPAPPMPAPLPPMPPMTPYGY